MKTQLLLLVVACLVIAAVPAGAQGPALGPGEAPTDPAIAATLPFSAKVSLPSALPKEPGISRLQGALDRLVKASVARTPLALEELALQEEIPLDGGRVLVVVEGGAARLPAMLEELGGEIDAVGGNFVALLAPVPALPAMAALDGVEHVRLPLPAYPLAIPDYGDAVSEGVSLLGATDWHVQGFQGQTIKVAVIDSGFYDWTGLQASSDLPLDTFCINDWSSKANCGVDDPGEKHGSACAQVIYDMAPGIEALYLYPFSYSYQIPLIVQDMIAKEIDVASMSWGWLNGEPNDGTGFISSAVNTAKDDGDIFWAVGAGNHRLRHWEGVFSDSIDDLDSCHDFDPASEEPTRFLTYLNYVAGDEEDVLNPTSGRFTAALTWNGWPTTNQDYDLYLYKLAGDTWIVADWSTDTQDGDDRPTELIHDPDLASGYYALAICSKGEVADGYLELFTWYDDLDYRYQVEASSLVEPATADGAMATAAFPWDDAQTLRYFSSLGPRNPEGGGPYLPGACEEPGPDCKPDFAGPDRIQVTFEESNEPFSGTSAAAPHLAGAAALVMGAYGYGADETYGFLQERALAQPDPLPPPPAKPLSTTMNNGWGWGRLWLGDHPGITSVDVASFRARPIGLGIQVEWEMASEVGLLGFNLHRSDQPEAAYTLLNQALIPAQAAEGTAGAAYTWLDSEVAPDIPFYYRLETRDLHGKSTFHGPVNAQLARSAPHRVTLPLVMSD